MSYADRQDLIDRFGQTEIESLDPGAADGAFARVTTALADAAAEIDAVVAAAWDLPLPPGPWPLLVAIASDIARARLYDDVAPETVTARATRARAKLRSIPEGRYQLLSVAGDIAPRRAGSGVQHVPPAGPMAQALRRHCGRTS
ncbi:phage protein Gp36 family protein [Tateyamaria sp.]|uniref:phage protein Gp36 family protein n=1 Tax=Tateyamaria sp. TaxID=1929288 RepID=UPI003B21211F